MTRWKWTLAATAILAVLLVAYPTLSSGNTAQAGVAAAQGGVTITAATQQHRPPAKRRGTVNPKRPPIRHAPPAAKPKPPTRSAANGGGEFADHAFPPTVSDTKYHKNAWMRDDCLRCHETGVGDAPMTRHVAMPADVRPILLTAKCRSCHVLVRGQKPKPKKAHSGEFAEFAFPPMIPASESHKGAWTEENCLLCHESGIKGAPVVEHKAMPAEVRPILLKSKCRSCHVQVRASSIPGR